MKSSVVKHSITIDGQKTSVSLKCILERPEGNRACPAGDAVEIGRRNRRDASAEQ